MGLMIKLGIAALKTRRGSYTLETSIVFPTIMCLFFGILYFGMHLYQHLVMAEAGTMTAMQAAETWTNSRRSLNDGTFSSNGSDGLYWRLMNNRSGSELVQRKLMQADTAMTLRMAPGQLHLVIQGDPGHQIAFQNRLYTQTVIVKARAALFAPGGIPFLAGGRRPAGTEAVSAVIEPAEWIRNLDLGTEYLGQVAEYCKGLFTDDGQEVPQKQVGEYVASTYQSCPTKKTWVYHLPGTGCEWAARILPKNMIRFQSAAEAESRGYVPCKVCQSKTGSGESVMQGGEK